MCNFLFALYHFLGWATWARAWEYFDPSEKDYLILKNDRVQRKAFDLEGVCSYYRMLESQLRGEIDSWAIRWYLCVFIHHGLVLYPPQTLIENIGFDGSGTHCSNGDLVKYGNSGMKEGRMVLEFSKQFSISDFNYRAIINYMRKSNSRGIVNKVKSLFG